MFTNRVIAIDGSKIKVVNSKQNDWTDHTIVVEYPHEYGHIITNEGLPAIALTSKPRIFTRDSQESLYRTAILDLSADQHQISRQPEHPADGTPAPV